MKTRYKDILQSLIVFILTFVLFAFATTILLDNDLSSNVFVILVYSFIVSAVSFGFSYFKLQFTYYLFLAGHFVGLALMIYAYMSDVSGWEEIIGFLSYLIFLIGGIVLGIIAQVIYVLYKRYK